MHCLGWRTWIQYFCSPQHTDSAFYPVIAQLERAAAFERRSGQSDSEEVMSSPTPYRNVTMWQPPYSADPTKRQRRGDVVTHALSQCNDVSRQQRPKLFPDLHKGAVDGCLGRNAQFVDDEKKFRFASIALNRRSLAIPADFGAIARLELSGRGLVALFRLASFCRCHRIRDALLHSLVTRFAQRH